METARAHQSGGGRDESSPDVLSGLEGGGGSASGDDHEPAEGPGLLRGGPVRLKTESVRLNRHRWQVIAGHNGNEGGGNCEGRPAVAARGPNRPEQGKATTLPART